MRVRFLQRLINVVTKRRRAKCHSRTSCTGSQRSDHCHRCSATRPHPTAFHRQEEIICNNIPRNAAPACASFSAFAPNKCVWRGRGVEDRHRWRSETADNLHLRTTLLHSLFPPYCLPCRISLNPGSSFLP